MYLPIVVLVAVLPGLYALRCWDLTPPGPWWGLRTLAVSEGRWLDQVGESGVGPESEARAYRTVAMQPPLYAWLGAVGMALGGDRALATVVPSYLAGAVVVLLVFAHGRLWRGPGLGVAAAILTGFNHELLKQMQQASPATLGLVGALGALLAYGQGFGAGEERRPGWALAGGLGLGLALMAVGPFGLLVVPTVLLHRAILGPDPWAGRRPSRWWARLAEPGRLAALAALAIGLALAAPWYAMMLRRHGPAFVRALAAPPHSGLGEPGALLSRLAMLAPTSLALGLFGALRAGRRLLTHDGDDPATAGGAFWVAWLAVAALAPAAYPEGPRAALNLFLLVPLNLLAAQTMLDLSGRRVPARALIWLAPATAVAVAWWVSPELRGAFTGLVRGRGPSASTGLGLHLGADLLIALVLLTRGLDRWARRRDGRRRLVLAGFLVAVAALTVVAGIREVRFRHQETSDLLSLREAILRRQSTRPFTVLAVVGPGPTSRFVVEADAAAPPPGGRLRFLLRAALPELDQIDLDRVDDLLRLPEGRRLVILAGSEERLPYAMQARLGLEAIHPGRSGVLDAYATAAEAGRPTRR